METCRASDPDPGVQIPPSPPFYIQGILRTNMADAHTLNEDRTEDTSLAVEDSTEITTGNIDIPEFPTILAPILSVLLIMGFNYRRRPNLGE